MRNSPKALYFTGFKKPLPLLYSFIIIHSFLKVVVKTVVKKYII